MAWPLKKIGTWMMAAGGGFMFLPLLAGPAGMIELGKFVLFFGIVLVVLGFSRGRRGGSRDGRDSLDWGVDGVSSSDSGGEFGGGGASGDWDGGDVDVDTDTD